MASAGGGLGSRLGDFARAEGMSIGVDVGIRADGSVVDERKLLLLSDGGDMVDDWSGLHDSSVGYALIRTDGARPSQLVRLVWQIGEPVVVCAMGGRAGNAALRAQVVSPGGFPTVFLVDFGVQLLVGDSGGAGSGWQRRCGRVVIVRSRQSVEVSHAEAVRAREMLLADGADCWLVEPESCGNDDGDLCFDALVDAIDWLGFGGG